MNYRIFVLCFLFIISINSCTRKVIIEKEESKSMISVIPKPEKITNLNGHFKFNDKIGIVIQNASLRPNAVYLADWIEQRAGYRLSVLIDQDDKREAGVIILSLDSKNIINDEAYRLQVNPGKIEIVAACSGRI